jgi:alpha-tubulin suppressor-like RCC1 family protein
VYEKIKTIKLKEKINKIFLGNKCMFLITIEGAVYSMGSGENFQLGNGSKEDTEIPKLVIGIGKFYFMFLNF